MNYFKMSCYVNKLISFIMPDSTSSTAISDGKITQGQGEYIVFHEGLGGSRSPVSRETFEKVYKVLCDYAPVAILNRGPASVALNDCKNRYEVIKKTIKAIDPTLEIAFIPRTLYELVLTRKCIREDLKNQSICPLVNRDTHIRDFESDSEPSKCKAKHLEKKCWHFCYYADANNNDHPKIKDIAYRLNRSLTKIFAPTAAGFTYPELAQFAEREIAFLQFYHETSRRFKKSPTWYESFLSSACAGASSSRGGATVNFSAYTRLNNLAVEDEEDALIFRNSVALDCSKLAQTSFLLFRGSRLKNDTPVRVYKDTWRQPPRMVAYPQSLSYGSSLLGASMHDTGATPIYYMKQANNPHAMIVPFERWRDSPFYIPTTNTIAQLFSHGSYFHARSKIWEGADLSQTKGIWTKESELQRLQDHLTSHLSQKELVAQFEGYKKRAVLLDKPISKL